MTKGLLVTAGLVGLFFAVSTLVLIDYGTSHYDSVTVGTSMGLTAFSLLLVVSAYQARSVTASTFTEATFDNAQLNWTALGEIALAVLITRMDVMRNLFGTVQLSRSQWALALVPAVVLFVLWELGKLIARPRATATAAAASASSSHPDVRPRAPR
jgi:Ca2+-transporting ATPase